jgi:hypothetical protein
VERASGMNGLDLQVTGVEQIWSVRVLHNLLHRTRPRCIFGVNIILYRKVFVVVNWHGNDKQERCGLS